MDALKLHIAEETRHPFIWGERDCLFFLARWHDRATGSAILGEVTGLYDDEAGARAVMDARGGMPAILESYCGAPIPVDEARRGDVGLIGWQGWHIGAILTGTYWVAKRVKGGVTFLRTVPALAYRVAW